MATAKIQGNPLGSGSVTLAAPNTNSDFTLNMPASSGTIATAESTLTQFNASGSAPVYAARAWVNFNGTGTVAIRASGNVSSITDNGAGDYTVNFTTALADANYASAVTGTFANGGLYVEGATDPTTTALRVKSYNSAGNPVDVLYSNVAIFR